MDLLLVPLWLFLPAGIANLTPVFAARVAALQRLNHPVDLGWSLGNIRLLGPNKTWRGLIVGVAAASLAFWLQQLVLARVAFLADSVNHFMAPTLLPYWMLGPLLGLGALLGDMVESFFKRRYRIQPGRPWFPYDQIDFILGAVLLSMLVVKLPLVTYVVGLALWTALQVVSQYIGFWLGIKENPI